MKVADFIIEHIAKVGIDKVFVVYGAAVGDLVDAFTRVKGTEYVAVMHEQGGGFAAEGYAKITGKPGVAIATSGPGGMNFVTPIGNCFYDSVPALFITGQINAQFLRPDESIRQIGFQETDIVSIVKPITKYAKMIRSANDIKFEIEKALFMAQDGRPGPVLLDIPLNIQKMDIDPSKLKGFNLETAKSSQNSYSLDLVDRQIELFLNELSSSLRPVMMVGGGVRLAGAEKAILELGRELKIPCYPTWNATDVICSDYEYYGGRIGTYGGAGRNFGIQNSDLLLAVGSRISGRITGGNVMSFARAAKKYVVDIDEANLQQHFQQVPFDVNILCDAKVFVDRMLLKVRELKKQGKTFYQYEGWLKQAMDWKIKYDPVTEAQYQQKEFVHPYAFMRTLSQMMSKSDIVIGDCGGNIVVMNHAFETKTGQRTLTNNGNSPMGFSFAGAMGCWLADPGRNVVCIIGDGGFNMNIQELQTVVTGNMKFKTFILNNHIYGITKAFQETNFQGRAEACGPKGYNPPNFIDICKAYGVKTETISSHLEMAEKIKLVLESDEAVVCDVNCHEHHTYEPRIFGWKTPIEDMYPYLPREEFKSNMMIPPSGDYGWEKPPMPDVIKSSMPTHE